jgi:tRNA 2-thiouridine synthesizing protein A
MGETIYYTTNFCLLEACLLSNRTKPDKNLDCVGLYCPEPVFRTRQELDKLALGEVLEVTADDPASEEDIPRLVKRLGYQLVEMRKENDEFVFVIKKVK